MFAGGSVLVFQVAMVRVKWEFSASDGEQCRSLSIKGDNNFPSTLSHDSTQNTPASFIRPKRCIH